MRWPPSSGRTWITVWFERAWTSSSLPWNLGPKFVADFDEIDNPEERQRRQREAHELVRALLEKLGVA